MHICKHLLPLKHQTTTKHLNIMKTQANNAQKIVFILLTVIAVITILNFFSFGFIFHFAFGASGLTQVAFCFASLLVGSISWALCEEFTNEYKF